MDTTKAPRSPQQVGKGSRVKGQQAERELALLLTELTGLTVTRRCRQHSEDIDLEGLAGWSIEVKRYASASRSIIKRWWAQAIKQAKPSHHPVLFYRVDRADWRCVWHPASAGLPVATDGFAEFDHLVESDPKAWWACVRDKPSCCPSS